MKIDEWFDELMRAVKPGRYTSDEIIQRAFGRSPVALDRKRLRACLGRCAHGLMLEAESCKAAVWVVKKVSEKPDDGRPDPRIVEPLITVPKPRGFELGTMNSFETAFEPLKGFHFATQQSLQNALLALYWSSQKRAGVPLKVPMIVITGPSGSGKSRLASIISNGVAPCCSGEKGDVTDFLLVASAIMGNCCCCVFEDVNKKLLESTALKTYLTATNWSYRPYGGSKAITVPAQAMVIITGNVIQLNADLARRSVVIELFDAEVPW